MKAHAVVLMALGVTACVPAGGCATYHDPATGEPAHYGCETLRTKLNADIGAVYGAARRATNELHLRVMRAAQDGISGEILARDAHRDNVDIQLGALPEGRTRLTIRVGVFGDKNKSIVLLQRILDNLSRQELAAFMPAVEWSRAEVGK